MPGRDLTPADLQNLHRQGLINQGFFTKAMDYLSKTSGKDASSTSPGIGAVQGTSSSPAVTSAGGPSATNRTVLYL
jgi:hypothetical protein